MLPTGEHILSSYSSPFYGVASSALKETIIEKLVYRYRYQHTNILKGCVSNIAYCVTEMETVFQSHILAIFVYTA